MLLSVVLYAGLILVAGGLLLLLPARTRTLSGRATIAGLCAILLATAWPVRESHAATRNSSLDAFMPAWQFNEIHTTHVNAPPGRVFDATHAVTAREILFLRTLFAIRRGFRKLPSSVQHAADEPFLDLATRGSFRYLADERPREIVVKTKIVSGVDAVMNFLITSDGRGGSNVSTETRVFADSAAGKRSFAVYWRLIQPGSDIIRRMWLRAIRLRAERA